MAFDLKPLLDALLSKRLWLFAAVGITSGVALFAPDVGPISLSAVRQQSDPWLTIAFVGGWVCFATAGLSELYDIVVKALAGRQKLRFTVADELSFWHPTQAHGGEPVAQIHIHGTMYNLGRALVRAEKAHILGPLQWGFPRAVGQLRDPERPRHGPLDRPTFPHRDRRQLELNFSLRTPTGAKPSRIAVYIILTDSSSKKHRFRVILSKTPG